MAADAEDLQTRASEDVQHVSLVTPFMAKSAISDKSKLFPVARWAPRAGFNMEHQRFTISLHDGEAGKCMPADSERVSAPAPTNGKGSGGRANGGGKATQGKGTACVPRGRRWPSRPWRFQRHSDRVCGGKGVGSDGPA